MCTDIFSLPLRALHRNTISKITELRVYYGARVYCIIILEFKYRMTDYREDKYGK